MVHAVCRLHAEELSLFPRDLRVRGGGLLSRVPDHGVRHSLLFGEDDPATGAILYTDRPGRVGEYFRESSSDDEVSRLNPQGVIGQAIHVAKAVEAANRCAWGVGDREIRMGAVFKGKGFPVGIGDG